ncbi:phage tail tape measure protein [Lysinibacillus sp. BPa_S21]|uniref:phage tail tape measure protein n=1 Tax=Lysinibacillus sp. BPa_S21 TaxID=2932478 RepID=UPI0024B329FB|nr:phage tail tape measure protein [Lysinibacillus sp. BPa_S21]
MATNNPIELLIALGVNDSASKNNIQNYLNKIKQDLKFNIELDATKGNGSSFDSMRKEIESLQKQVARLNQELSSVGTGKSHSPTLSQGIKRDVVESIKSLDQLKNHINQQNGEYKIKTITDSQGLEKIDAIVTRVKTGLNQIQEVHLKPILDTNNMVVGLKQVTQFMHDISSKDLKVNVSKGIEELNKFARQGELSKEQYEQFRNSISSSISNTELNKVLESMRSINKETAHENKMQNAMANINQQAIELSQKLNQFTKDKNSAFDPVVVDRFIGKLDKLAGVNFDSVKGMKSANTDFSSVEKEINTYIKLQERYKDVTNNLELLQRQGKITSSDLANFTQDAKLATTVTQLNNLNKEINQFSKNTHIDAQVSNAFKNISNEVEQLNNKLKNVTNSFNVPSNNALFSKIKSDIDSINNTKINTPEDIKTLNKLISDTSKNIRQLGQDSISLNQFEIKTREINDLLQRMRESGLLTNREINKFADSLSRIETGNLAHVNNLLTQMSTKFDKLKNSEKNLDTFEKQQNSLSRLNSELTRTEKLFPRTMNKSKAEELRKEIEKLSKLNVINPTTLKNNQKEIDALREKVKQLHAESTQSSKSSEGIVNSLRTALQKFPVWMFSATLFYAPIRGVKDLTERVIELDTAMTQLRRVMDIPDYKFNEILEKSIENTEKLSGKVGDYLKLVGEFGRTGKNDQESMDLANTATLIQNISELTADEAVNSLTAAMISFGIAAEDSLTIADKLNEVDNNYSITTKDLSLSMNKAASTAKTFGVSLDELLGYTTAIGAATRESGNIVGNSLKTIFSRITTNDSAIGALNDINISINDMEGNVKPVSKIIGEIAGKWDKLTDAERQNTSVKVAGVYQLSRFNALMLNYQMAQDSTATSMDSFNSAMREQEEYSKSLQARINRLDTAWMSFASTAGDKVLYDGIVVVTEALKGMTDGSNTIASKLGVLAPVFGLVGMSAYGLSKNLRTLITTTYAQSASTVAATGSTGIFAGALTGLRTVASLTTVALRGLMIATGVGVAFAGVGFVLEKLTSAMSNAIQKEEELANYNNKNMSALTENKTKIEELISTYKQLNAEKEDGKSWDSNKEKEYLKVQQQLSEVFPALVDHIDSTGQAHLKNKEAIDHEIDSTNKLIDAQNKITVNKAIDEFEKLSNELNGSWYDSISNYFYGSLEASIKQQKQIIEAMQKNGIDTSAQELELMNLEQQYQQSSEKIKGYIFEVTKAMADMNGTEIDSALSNSLQKFIYSLDLSNLDAEKLKSFSNELGKIQEKMQKAIDTSKEGLFKDAVGDLNKLASQTNGFDSKLDKFKDTYSKLSNAIENGNQGISVATDEFDELDGSIDEVSDSTNKLAAKMSEFKDVTEQMAGVSQSGVDALNDLILRYDMLTYQLAGYTQKQLEDIYTKENLTSKEQEVKKVLDERVAIMKEMSSVYPDLLDKDGKAIFLSDEKRKAIEVENKANEVLLKGYKLAREGKLNAEQQATLASASGAKARINNLKVEILMLEKYIRANQIALSSAVAINSLPLSGVAGLAMKVGFEGQQKIAQGRLASARAELDSLSGSLSSNIGKIQGFTSAIENSSKSTKGNTKSTKDNTKAAKENNAEKEKSIWITDKYKQKLEELNLAIEKQQKLQSKFPEYSNEYKKSLEAQIKLEKEKLALQQKQAKTIQSQIASGKIQQTGNVSIKSNSNGKINGYDGRITSTYGSRADKHRGVDIAMNVGTRVDAPVSGKVIKAGSATSDKNGKAMHWSYGNLVVIEDKNGIRHLLAHLDKTLVKVGDQVQAGTQIGKSGNTGKSTGPHLHYEQNNSKGQTINPTSTLNAIRSNKTTPTTSSASSQQAVVWNYFKNKGLNDKAIAGLMGNIQQESSFNTNAGKNAPKSAYGIAQWRGSRLTGLNNYAKSVGKSANDMQVQLEYMWKELNSTEKNALTSLQRSDLSASSHASEFDRLFERSGRSHVPKRQNYADQYYKQFAGTNGGAGVGIDTTQQAIDQAKSDLNGLNADIMQQEEAISNLEKQLIDVTLSAYEHKKSNYDKVLENGANRLNKLIKSSQAYRDELDRQIVTLNEKKKVNQAEMAMLNKFIKSGKLSAATVAEYTDRLHELGKVNSEIDFAIKDIDTSKLESYVALVDEVFAKYDVLRKEKDTFIQYENIAIEELDTSSLRYLQTLDKINSKMREKQNINRQELTSLELLVKSNKLSGEALEKTKDRITELNSQIKQLQLEIQNGDFNIIVNIKTQSDAVIGNMQFEIDRNEAIRKMYEEGSADYKKYTENILKQYEKMAQKHLETRDALVEELKQRDITAERIKEVKKLLEEEHLAYLNATLSIKDYTKQLEEANKSQLEGIADKIINAYKEYVQERRDEHMKMIDDEIKRENEKHEKIMKQLNDEMDLFRKNVEEKLRLIDRQEAERDYNMQIDDMEKERDKLQSEYNLLLLDNSNEAKQKRKKLQEQLDKIDKDIAEKRHDRDIELQKQGLNDLLETKEDEINGKIELQDKEHENTIHKINREKEYWEKHYNDLLNDERKFARIREDILAGHFDKVMSEFEGYIAEMIATMPELEDTLDGTMQAVGTSIRQNVIDHLREAISLINEFNSTQIGSNSSFGEFNPGNIFDENKGNGIGTSNGNLTQGDMKVLLGKYLTDNVANQLSGSAKNNAHTAGSSLGSEGRKEGSKIDKNTSFDNAIKGLTSAELEALNQYFEANKHLYGGQYEKYINDFLKGNGSYVSSGDISGTDKYGLGNILTNGDMQVLMAKYVNESLLGSINDSKQRASVKSIADKMASDGRNNGMSKLEKNISFGAITSLMSRSQANQLRDFMNANSGAFGDATLQSQIKKYAASLDTGGFMNWSGSGIDGKGGKAIIAHPNEIMLNKVDTKGFFDSINVMDKVMSSIKPILAKFTPQPIQSNQKQSGDIYQIQFGDVIEANKDQAETFATSFINNVKRKKGGRF